MTNDQEGTKVRRKSVWVGAGVVIAVLIVGIVFLPDVLQKAVCPWGI